MKAPVPDGLQPLKFIRRQWLQITVGVAALVAVGTWALFEYVIWNRIPSPLVGKWVVVDGPQDGAIFDFYPSGAMVGHINAEGRLAIINATVRVDGQKIYSTTWNPKTVQYDTNIMIIHTLNENEFVVEDEQGNRLRMIRNE